MYNLLAMSFTLAHHKKMADAKTLTPTKVSPTHHPNLSRGSSDHILHLQRMFGNHVQRLIHSNAGGFDFGKIAIQPKMKVSQQGDVYEQEADRVSELMRMSSIRSDSALPVATAKDEGIDCKCACEMVKEDDKKLTISRKPSTDIS